MQDTIIMMSSMSVTVSVNKPTVENVGVWKMIMIAPDGSIIHINSDDALSLEKRVEDGQ
jgi:hypothetical protein